MKYREQHQKSAKMFLACLVITFLFVSCLLMSGCQTANGAFRDVESLGGLGRELTQNVADGSQDWTMGSRARDVEHSVMRANKAMAAWNSQ